jgi:hypothetical protein
MEAVAPRRACDTEENELPKRANARIETLEPTITTSHRDKSFPRPMPWIESAEPALPKARKLIELPQPMKFRVESAEPKRVAPLIETVEAT